MASFGDRVAAAKPYVYGLVVGPVRAGALVAFWALLVAIWVIPGKTTAIRGRKWGLDKHRILEESR